MFVLGGGGVALKGVLKSYIYMSSAFWSAFPLHLKSLVLSSGQYVFYTLKLGLTLCIFI